jgi:hypothetical protein
MGRTVLLDAKPLSNLLARLGVGRLLDDDQRYFEATYDSLAGLVSDPDARLLSTHAVATEALHFLLNHDRTSDKIEAIRRAPVHLRPGNDSDLREFGEANIFNLDFAEFTLIRAWQSLYEAGVRPYPITVTTDHPLAALAASRFEQNVYTMEDLESNPRLL